MTAVHRKYPLDVERAQSIPRYHPPRFPERRLVESLVEAALEAGQVGADAVTSAIKTYQELNLRAKDDPDSGKPIQLADLKLIRRYAIAAMRGGCDPVQAATRAMLAWSGLRTAQRELHGNLASQEARERVRKKKGMVKGGIKTLNPMAPGNGGRAI